MTADTEYGLVNDPAGFEAQAGYQGEWDDDLYRSWTGDESFQYYRYEPYLLTHRYFDPSTGKFASRDPIGTRGGENLYGYAGDDPVNEVDPSGDAAAVAAWPLLRVIIPGAVETGEAISMGTVVVATGAAVLISGGIEATRELVVAGATGGVVEGPLMRGPGAHLANLLVPPALGAAADPRATAILAEMAKGDWDKNGDYDATSYENARNAAVGWLVEHGFSAQREVLSKGLAGTAAGVPIGMETSNGKVGFRVEWDETSGAHINVWDENLPKGEQAGPHFRFPGTAADVESIQERFAR